MKMIPAPILNTSNLLQEIFSMQKEAREWTVTLEYTKTHLQIYHFFYFNDPVPKLQVTVHVEKDGAMIYHRAFASMTSESLEHGEAYGLIFADEALFLEVCKPD